MNIDEVKLSIKNWSSLIKSAREKSPIVINLLTNYLNQGNYFGVTRAEFFSLIADGSEDQDIHVYAGVSSEGYFQFFLISSEDDQKGNFNNILVKDFNYGAGRDFDINILKWDSFHEIPESEALRRAFMWKMFCHEYVYSTFNLDAPMVQLITISTKDFLEIYNSGPNSTLVNNFIGLRSKEDNSLPAYEIEMILTGEFKQYQVPKLYIDVTRPIPPLGGDKPEMYQLLVQSGAVV